MFFYTVEKLIFCSWLKYLKKCASILHNCFFQPINHYLILTNKKRRFPLVLTWEAILFESYFIFLRFSTAKAASPTNTNPVNNK